MKHLQVILLALLVVLSGCGGTIGSDQHTTSPTPTSTATPHQPATTQPTETREPPQVEVKNGSLPVNATEVWHRVHELRGQEPPDSFAPTVVVKPLPNQTEQIPAVGYGFDPPRSPDRLLRFGELIGIGWKPSTVPEPTVVGGRASRGTVALLIGDDAPADRIEATLAHEFEHLLQPDSWVSKDVPETALKEGGATYIKQAYANRYLPNLDPLESIRERYLNSTTGGEKFFFALYYFGYRHFEQRIDSPADISDVYDKPPTTYEQLIHGQTPNRKSSASLNVRVINDTSLQAAPVGELVLRVSLATELNEATAAEAAVGWEDDTVIPFDGTQHDGNYVWLVKMNDERNATELERAFQKYLDKRATFRDGAWQDDQATYRLVRTNESTISLIVGSEGFVEGASVNDTGESIRVSVEKYK